MIGLLGFVLELSAIGLFAGLACSALLHVLWRLLPTASLAAAVRSDLAFLVGILPALTAAALVLAAAVPSLIALLGGGDHCLGHDHHVHICLVHASELRPPLAFLGVLSLGVTSYRFGAFVLRERLARRRVDALQAIAAPAPAAAPPARFPVVWIPGAARLCHAAGIHQRRILISRSLAESLRPDQLHAAIAHEEAHLARRDPLARLLLGAAGAVALPQFTRALLLAFRDASEEACDASAAHRIGDRFVVADALVAVARLQLAGASGLLAFGASSLERRVRALLDGALPMRASRFLTALAVSGLAAGAIAGYHHAAIHHAVETLLSATF